MKKIFNLLLLVPMLAAAQPKIVGLGPFKIGKTVVADLNKLMEEQHQYFSRYLQEDSNVCIYTGQIFDFGGSTTPNLSLYFYKDTLYGVGCNPSYELIQAIELKYGAPHKKATKQTIFCRTGLKISYSEVETTTTSTYTNVAKGITAVEYSGSFFNEHCEKMGLDTLSIQGTHVADKVANASLTRFQRAERARVDSIKEMNTGL